MTKVLFVTEGGRNAGFGHLARCLALGQAFEERGLWSGYILSGDESVKNILGTRECRFFDWIENEKKLMHLIEDTRIVVVDSYNTKEALYNKISLKADVPVYIDDLGQVDVSRGIVINWNIYAPNLKFPDRTGVTYLLGPDYVALRKPFWEVPKKEIRKDVDSVLVTFGGDDSRNLTPVALALLVRHFPAMTKYVVLGRAFENTSEIAAVADGNTRLIESPDDEGMRNLMMKSDVAISGGGQTLYELARTGVPTIAVTVADNQKGNVEEWEKTGFIENAGCWDGDRLVENLKNRFRRLMDIERRLGSCKIGQDVVGGNGARKIVDIIKKHLTKCE
jgi:spore coat polysaccharide biosynthesis predicted glycosyltransferase SpsG